MIRYKVTGAFRKDYKKLIKQSKNLKKLDKVMSCIIDRKPLSLRYKDHVLKGNWRGRRECHIEPDWLLIYKLGEDVVMFERTGSHGELFE